MNLYMWWSNWVINIAELFAPRWTTCRNDRPWVGNVGVQLAAQMWATLLVGYSRSYLHSVIAGHFNCAVTMVELGSWLCAIHGIAWQRLQNWQTMSWACWRSSCGPNVTPYVRVLQFFVVARGHRWNLWICICGGRRGWLISWNYLLRCGIHCGIASPWFEHAGVPARTELWTPIVGALYVLHSWNCSLPRSGILSVIFDLGGQGFRIIHIALHHVQKWWGMIWFCWGFNWKPIVSPNVGAL